jgi:DNA segregation ATPase FtsK/SpoIIIE, S-DNA-T family
MALGTRVGHTQTALPLIIVDSNGASRDVFVQFDHEVRGAELIAAITRELDLADPVSEIVCARTRRALDPNEPLGSARLIRGDRLLIDPPRDYASRDGTFGELPLVDTPFELVLLGGPAAGRRFPLRPDENLLGRDPELLLTVDDPSLSARHCAIRVSDTAVTLADLDSRNGTYVEGVALTVDENRVLSDATLARAGRTLFAVQRRRGPTHPVAADNDGTVAFNRQPRVAPPFTPLQITLERPPDEPRGASFPMAMALAPLVLGLVLWLVTRSIITLAMVGLSPLLMVTSVVTSKRSGKLGYKRRLSAYLQQLGAAQAQLENARAGEATSRRAAAPPLSTLLDRAHARDPQLWERRPSDADFLRLRLGSRSQPSQVQINEPGGGAEEARKHVDELRSWYGETPEVPVVCNLPELGSIGLTGERHDVAALARALVVQAVTLHSPADLTLAAAVSDDNVSDWEWLKWLPHSYSDGGGQLLVRDRDAASELFDTLIEVKEQRSLSRALDRTRQPAMLFVVEESIAPSAARVRRLLNGCAGTGIAVLWLGSSVARLPGDCSAYAELDPDACRLSFSDTRTGETTSDVTADLLPLRLANDAAIALAPLTDVSAESSSSRLPARIALSAIVSSPFEGQAVADQWSRARDLGATIGMAGDEPFSVDLRRDGPHSLVAGTTGSGKSELLQTLIASLALAHPPTRLNFLLIDYKGGLAFQECVGLPHTVGLVTDLDDHLAKRVLLSLDAELRRREALIKEHRAKDLVGLEAKAGQLAPPALLIAIDEFATLVDDVPEFIDGVVDVAQRGRGVGVHLLLATQRPGSVVNANVRANTKLKVALKVTSAAESTDIIEAPDAATIPASLPGRAYARTEHNELTPFQTAFVGAPLRDDAGESQLVVRPFGLGDMGTDAVGADLSRASETELHAIVKAAQEAATLSAIPPPRRPWLGPLPQVLPVDALPEPIGTAAVCLGLIDEPSLQSQRPFAFDPVSTGSLLIFGAGGTGKTTLLRTLAFQLAKRESVSALNIYGLDFAGGGLRVLEALPHCGAAVPGENEDMVERLFRMLKRALDDRKRLFAEIGAFAVEDFRERRPDTLLPRLLVLLDGYAGFAATFERINAGALPALLLELQRDGQPFGIHFAVTADRRGTVPSAFLSSVPSKVIMRMNSDDDYAALGLDLRVTKGVRLPVGGAFVEGGLVMQTAVISSEHSAEAQSHVLSTIGAELRQEEQQTAPSIQTLPTTVRRSDLPVAETPLHGVFGLSDSDMKPLQVDLTERHLLVAGPRRSGRTTALATIAEGLKASTPGLQLHLLAPRRGDLGDLQVWSSVLRGDECESGAASLLTQFAASTDALTGSVVVVDDAELLGDGPAGLSLEHLIRLGRDRGLRLVVACDKQVARVGYGAWIKELRAEEHWLLLRPDPGADRDLVGPQLPLRLKAPFPPGRGYLITPEHIELVQVAADSSRLTAD